ncbi:hypothetical protein F5884DRAFT_788653 [Xylogone sp. PMI_703]|nr:hypothetical protein F5884DRAFT_788653 [Xylogone sp. PMI_703]
MKIYLAGPDVFEHQAVQKGEALKALCAKHNAEGLFPLDNAFHGIEHGSLELATAIREANMDLIRACDAVVANMAPFRGPSMDVGTAYEMGVGAALGKVVVGYSKDDRSYVEKVGEAQKVERASDGQLRDEEGMAVEEFASKGVGLVDNLMISCGMERYCASAEEAIQAAIEIFEARK